MYEVSQTMSHRQGGGASQIWGCMFAGTKGTTCREEDEVHRAGGRQLALNRLFVGNVQAKRLVVAIDLLP